MNNQKPKLDDFSDEQIQSMIENAKEVVKDAENPKPLIDLFRERPCPFCGKNKLEAPKTCVCTSETLMHMTRGDWNTRPLESALQSALTTAQAENKRYKDALEFYAEIKNYQHPFDAIYSEIEKDCGVTARSALNGGKNVSKI